MATALVDFLMFFPRQYSPDFRIDINTTFGVQPIIPITAAIVYLAFLYIYPRYVRLTFNPKYLMLLHNVFLSVFSAVIFVGMVHALISRLISGYTTYDLFCDPQWRHHTGSVGFWLYLFYLSKIYEFLDTVFTVLKGKKPTFLHVSHHVMTLFNAYIGVVLGVSCHWIGHLSNTLIHTFMYYYYAVNMLGYHVWWKKYLTAVQIIQFWITLGSLQIWGAFHFFGEGCSGTWYTYLYTTLVHIAFHVMFTNFYRESYTQKKSAAASKSAASSINTKKSQ